MEKLIATIQKGKPFFDKVARNKYLKAVKDGFISCMPIVIFSSIFLLVAYVPNIWGFTWPANIEAIITKPFHSPSGIRNAMSAEPLRRTKYFPPRRRLQGSCSRSSR